MADTPDTRDPKGAPAPYVPVTPDATLRSTYAREQPYRHHWPKSYEKGMADPIIARVVDMLARRQVTAFGRRRADRVNASGVVYVVTPPETPQGIPGAVRFPPKGLAPGEIDRKRAASGDDTDKED